MSTVKRQLQPNGGQIVRWLGSTTGISPTKALSELIDNGFGAGANNIHVIYDRKSNTLKVVDDGRGADHIEDMVTPFRQRESETNRREHFGVGSTIAPIHLVGCRGRSDVVSTTSKKRCRVVADWGHMSSGNELLAEFDDERPSRTDEATGTAITLYDVIDLTASHWAAIRSDCALSFIPAFREGKKILITIDGKSEYLEAYEPPPFARSIEFRFEFDGQEIRGMVARLKPPKPGERLVNKMRGWGVALAHRILKCYGQPSGDREIDLGRVYAEVYLPKSWTNINDLKSDFREEPDELWAKLAEFSAPILDELEEQDASELMSASTSHAQELLDQAMGFETRERLDPAASKRTHSRVVGGSRNRASKRSAS